MNLLIVRDGVLITPPLHDNVLEGITRNTVLQLARELGIETIERSIDRTELYVADEVLFCGTGAQVAALVVAAEADEHLVELDLVEQHCAADLLQPIGDPALVGRKPRFLIAAGLRQHRLGAPVERLHVVKDDLDLVVQFAGNEVRELVLGRLALGAFRLAEDQNPGHDIRPFR
jgi:hypothetical protein